MEYIYFELDTGGPTPLYSMIHSLCCVFSEGCSFSVKCWDIHGLSEELNALREFSYMAENYRHIAFPDEKAVSYLSECLKEYRIPDPIKKMDPVFPELDINSFNIPAFNGELRLYFDNYKDYFYLPLEDTAIHSSLAEFVDKSAKQRATRETAYIKKAGTFIPAGNSSKNIFKKDLHDKESFVLIEEADASAILHHLIHKPSDA